MLWGLFNQDHYRHVEIYVLTFIIEFYQFFGLGENTFEATTVFLISLDGVDFAEFQLCFIDITENTMSISQNMSI